jgi:hypothetical protein
MSHRDESMKDLATLYAQAILGWHVQFGNDERQRQIVSDNDERLAHYQQIVSNFRDGDLSDPAVQLAIANEQISGSMEWAYGRSVEDILPGIGPEHRKLGDIARELRGLALQFEQGGHPGDARQTFEYSPEQKRLLARAQSHYATVTSADVQGGGGLSFLLSCSLERSLGHESDEILLLSPEFLGASPAPQGRNKDILDQVKGNGLEILDVEGN